MMEIQTKIITFAVQKKKCKEIIPISKIIH